MAQTFQTIPTLKGSLWTAKSAFFSTNSAVFYDGSMACLIDPGILPLEIMSILNFMETQHLKPEYILLTHSHWDHILGPEYFPNVRVITHNRFCDELSGDGAEQVANCIQVFERENQVKRIRSFRLPVPDITFEDTLSIQIGEITLNVIYAPGHSADQFTVYDPVSKILWAADMLSNIEIPFIYDSLQSYENTLSRLNRLEIQHLIPGHGSYTSSLHEIETIFKEDRAYLDELGSLIQTGIQAGKSLEEVQKDCSSMNFRNREDNTHPHQANIEKVYKELFTVKTS